MHAQNRLAIEADNEIATIDKNIYGHFAEHLGRCIYDGIWVGESSPIPNRHGIRLDVVEALKKIRPGVLRWAGAALPRSITGATRLARPRSEGRA